MTRSKAARATGASSWCASDGQDDLQLRPSVRYCKPAESSLVDEVALTMLDGARVIAVLCTGLYAGIIFGDRMGASFARPAMSAADFVIFQQIQHVHFKPLLLPVVLASVVGGLVWAWSLRSKPDTAEFWLATAGTGAMLAAAVLTRIVNFPINDALMTWIPGSPPPNMRTLWVSWEHAHTIRAVLAVGGFLCEVLALNARGSA